MKAVRHAVESFFSELAGRNVLLHEDQVVFPILTWMTFRSPAMVEEPRRLWCLPDTNNIKVRAHYIRLAANVRADKLGRHLNGGEWKI
jgi:hypothetical protein